MTTAKNGLLWLTIDGKRVTLSPQQIAILHVVASRPGGVHYSECYRPAFHTVQERDAQTGFFLRRGAKPPKTTAQRASLSRMIKRLVQSGLLTEESRGFICELTELGRKTLEELAKVNEVG